MVRQEPGAFDVTPEGMPTGDLQDIWQSNEYEEWLDAQDDQKSALKLGIFGAGWVRGSADFNDFVGFSGTIPSLIKVKDFIMDTISSFHPDEVYVDIMTGNSMNTVKVNMHDKNDIKRLMGIFRSKQTTENAGGAAPTSAPIGTDMFDTEDDIANSGMMMQFEGEDYLNKSGFSFRRPFRK